MREYSKIYKFNKGEYRYNYKEAQIEYITKVDYDFNDKMELITIKLDAPKVLDASGLSRDDWKESPLYWVEYYDNQIQEEVSYMMEGEFDV